MHRLTLTTGMLAASVALALSGCTSEQHVPTPSPVVTTHASPSVQALYGKKAIFLSAFVAKFANYLDPSVLPGKFILEKAGRGPATYALPSLSTDADQLILTIFCDEDSRYSISLISNGKSIDRTWGDSCGPRSGLVTYRTAPIPVGSRATLEIGVTVQDKTHFRTSIVEVATDG
jgi:hypothetical protein